MNTLTNSYGLILLFIILSVCSGIMHGVAIEYEEVEIEEQRRSLTQLRMLLGDFETFQADYNQFTSTAKTLDNPEEFFGKIYWKRPARVKLEQQMPWYELHVSDGKNYWHYDEDLEQAVKYSAAALRNQFITLLIKSDLSLLDEWNLMQWPQSQNSDDSNSYIFVAQSKNLENQQTVNLFFTENIPVKILVDTGLGEILTIEFHNVEKGVKLSNRSFTFKPPAGVEIIDSANSNG